MNEHDIAQRIRSALDAERWGDYDVEAFPVGEDDTDVTIFVENGKTDESYEFLVSIDRQG